MAGREGPGHGVWVAEKGRLSRGSGVVEVGRGAGVDEWVVGGGVGTGLTGSGGMPASPGKDDVKCCCADEYDVGAVGGGVYGLWLL
jgi:hypothetical protein